MRKSAAAAVTPVRQRTQYTCMATSMMMCLKANGVDTDEDTVNRVMGAQPMQGASWENAIACAQHYGMRVHLICPATLRQVKEFTDRGTPVMIAWNPEGREWSHASVIFDVGEDLTVSVADPNIPDPDETVRIVSKDDFYHKWFEKWPHYLVRRTAMAIEREITPEGRQMAASLSQPLQTRPDYSRLAYEVYVNEHGQACDDEGNCWVDKSSPSGTYGLNTYPGRYNFSEQSYYQKKVPVRSMQMVEEIREKSYGILLSMLKFGKLGSKEAAFVYQMMTSNLMMSKKQSDWFNSIYDRYEKFIQTIPKSLLNNPYITIKTHSLIISKNPKWENWARTVYEVEESKNSLILLGPAKKSIQPLPPQSDKYTPKHMEALMNFLAKRPGDKFMAAMQDLVEKGKIPSEAQLKAIRQNLYRVGMRQEADLFRSAEEAKTAGYSGNPDGKDIYPVRIDHGYEQPISGGSDVMQNLVKNLRREQGLRVAARYLAKRGLK